MCKNVIINPSFEAFTAVKIQVEVFRVVTPCSVVVGYQRFGGPYCLHLQGIILKMRTIITLKELREEMEKSRIINSGKYMTSIFLLLLKELALLWYCVIICF
jgi:hypothetical protein